MELICKKDAIHAVLHNTGDAAVAAIENIKPIFRIADGLLGAKTVQICEIKAQTLDEWRKEQTDAID